MIDIEFDLTTIGGASDDPFLDGEEVGFLLESTKHHITQHVQNRLGQYRCPTHGQPARVVVRGQYDLETEQLEVEYGIDACCNAMVMQSAALLGR